MKKSALYTVFLVVLIDLMGFGIVLPLLPFYASQFGASAVSIGLLYSVYSFAQLLFSPIWGGFSDRIGRRPIMLLSTLGSFLAYLIFAYSNSFGILFFSRLLAGVMGGNISTAQAYVADVTEHDDRVKGMGLLGAAFGIGFIVGPGLASLLVHPAVTHLLPLENKYALPGFAAALMSALSFLLVLMKLPETVDKKCASGASGKARPSVFAPSFWKSLARQGRSSEAHVLPLLFGSMFLLSFGQASLYSTFPLFCSRELGLTAEKVGMQFVYMGLAAALIQGVFLKRLEKIFGEKRLFLAGGVLMAGGLALIPFAPSAPFLTAFLLVMAIGGSLNMPILNSLISKKAQPAQMGAMMGSSQGLAALGRMIGPTWGGLLFGVSFKHPFLVTALLVSLTIFTSPKLEKS
ncbi:MAG: MFS transporter [Candidatus Omnitrophota bacterium]